jgi:hypothetical protein
VILRRTVKQATVNSYGEEWPLLVPHVPNCK